MEQKKLVLIGLPKTGKTTISQVIFKGKSPTNLLNESLKPTKGLDTSRHNWLDLDLFLFDTAGQNYQKIFSDKTRQGKILGGSTYIIYLIDFSSWSKKETQEKMLKDIDSLEALISEAGFDTEFLIFFHKIDLIDDEERDSYIKNVRKTLESKGLKIFFTSIHPNHIYSLYTSFYEILSCFSHKRTVIKEILDKNVEGLSKSMLFVTNDKNCIVGQAMTPDFDIESVEATYNLAAQLNLTLERIKSNDKINHLILQTINDLNIIMNYLDLLEEDVKNLICISETLTSNRLIWKAGETVTQLRKALISR